MIIFDGLQPIVCWFFLLIHEGSLGVTGEKQRDAERHGESQGGTARHRERNTEA